MAFLLLLPSCPLLLCLLLVGPTKKPEQGSRGYEAPCHTGRTNKGRDLIWEQIHKWAARTIWKHVEFFSPLEIDIGPSILYSKTLLLCSRSLVKDGNNYGLSFQEPFMFNGIELLHLLNIFLPFSFHFYCLDILDTQKLFSFVQFFSFIFKYFFKD